ncbi:MAG: amidohydrolase [Deltaproteobacteria bacterium]|nr:amidohydrolase [Deltaproteobacteria bacterium]MBI3077034.1 amidohydrolase [Deltaproteobacteria bacterium]
MDVIDFHVHIGEPRHYPPGIVDYLREESPEFYARWDEFNKPAVLAQFLREQGVRYAVLLAQVTPPIGVMIPNEYVAEYCSGIEMFLPFCSVNPRVHPDPARELERLVRGFGFRGLKLYPPYQHYYPNAPEVYPLYAKAADLGIPVMVHTGSSVFQGSRIKYGDPVYLDDVAVDFPELTLLIVHSGRGFWYDAAFFLARLHRNVYMEVAGLPPKRLPVYFPELERNADKIIFGSDWPTPPGRIRENIEAIQRLPLQASSIEKILYRNAERLLFGRG